MSRYTVGLYTKGYGVKSRDIPTLKHLLELQPTSCRAQIAQNLGVCTRTLQRYEADNHAPRAVLLALYHESVLGRENAHAQLFNECRAHAQHAALLQTALRKQDRSLAPLLQRPSMAANAPVFFSQIDLFAPDGFAFEARACL